MLPSRSPRVPVRLGWLVVLMSVEENDRTLAGTLSRSMPLPSTGVVPITSTVGNVVAGSSAGDEVCAFAAAESAADTAHAASHLRGRPAIPPPAPVLQR